MDPTNTTDPRTEQFIQRWHQAAGSELATAQSFVIELCELLGVERPHATADQDYMFERPLKEGHSDGSESDRRVDCYKRGHFILEAKKVNTGNHTKSYSHTLMGAHAQAQNYARALPAAEGRPPIILVVDVGQVIQLFAEFSRTGGNYIPYPDPRSYQIKLQDLRDHKIRQRLHLIWTDPMALDPSRTNAKVTRQVASVLASVAKSLEADGHPPHQVGAFLTRCLFSMFAEDVGLLPASEKGEGKGAFTELLQTHRQQPPTLQRMLQALWADMDRGGFSAALAREVLKFNGKLFKASQSEGYALPLHRSQIDSLLETAKANWTEVEPAIFGTLLERALDPDERHALGAHFTPRAYVDRLVVPTVIDPLRAEWSDTQAATLVLMGEHDALNAEADQLTDGLAQQQKTERRGKAKAQNELDAIDKLRASARAKRREAIQTVKAFHHRLCTVRVLDPACGSGNFLYVTLEHLKRLEGEVLNQLEALDNSQNSLNLEGETVSLQQLLGIEINSRAAALAELVLWIGYLQWQARTVGVGNIAEPVVHDYGNIQNRDAVLAYDSTEPLKDGAGQIVTRWDSKTFKPHPVTGLNVPDESAQVVQMRYIKPRKAQWPRVHFIVGNPPFIGASTMRAALGDGYVDALRSSWPEVPESADLVMYWWHQAAQTVSADQAQRFGFITTNSIKQTFNRRVMQAALDKPEKPLSLIFAVADHPWVDGANGAAVRIAMTAAQAGEHTGRLLTVQNETPQDDGEVAVTLSEAQGLLHADLRIGANVAAAKPLQANLGLSNRGVQLFGAGFIVTRAEAVQLGLGTVPGLEKHIREYRNGRDLTASPRNVMVIDMFGLSAEELRQKYPAAYQWLLEKVKPERDQNNRATYRDNWWFFGEPRKVLRHQLQGLPRYIATVETTKHRVFQFLHDTVLPDNKLVAIALQDAYQLGVLSSSLHTPWALSAGSWLGVGNDPVYVKTRCFETFPFPAEVTGLTHALSERIRHLAEQLDAHRKTQQAAHPDLTLTGMYNVLEKLRSGEALSAKDKTMHQQGLVSVLRTLHDELDAAVLAAYGWQDLGPVPQKDEAARAAWTDALLQRLVDLNTRRAAEEATGTVRWLRPEYQNPPKPVQTATHEQTTMDLPGAEMPDSTEDDEAPTSATKPVTQQAWPATLPEQIKAVADILSAAPSALDLDAIAAHFKGRGRWRERLPMILDTLVAIGRVRTVGKGGWANV
ncbi:class I SAM-dependent DNA methyltransferase [Limnohabitans sp.]|uniref:class I SAM-dependent DNA methyltransferase n=1 Tax=Limnohabitans sp. TaxID=1907725 RepID=UPI0039BCA8D1|nr:class I SAM-dependent DNA methyltransferase [Comamonadaceae bacterium]